MAVTLSFLKQACPTLPDMYDWLVQLLPTGSSIGLDGNVFTTNEVNRIQTFFSKKGISVVADFDLFEEIRSDRPSIPDEGYF